MQHSSFGKRNMIAWSQKSGPCLEGECAVICIYIYIYACIYILYIYYTVTHTDTHTFIKSIQSLFLLRVGAALKPRFFPEGPGGFCHRRPCAQRCHDWLRDFEVRGAVGGGLGHGKAPPGAVEGVPQ